jgi:hypothetical protein
MPDPGAVSTPEAMPEETSTTKRQGLLAFIAPVLL